MITHAVYEAIIRDRFGGVLRSGVHQPDSLACALEAYAIAIGHVWTDNPERLSMPDLRPLNDGPWSSDAARTGAMIPLVVAVSEWSEWSEARRLAWVTSIVIATVREIVAELPDLPESIRIRCHAATSLIEAEAATAAARAAATAWAARAAATAAEAAGAASAASAATDRVLAQACEIWIQAARLSEPDHAE